MLKTYLDNAATTPMRPEVIKIIVDNLHIFGNPSSSHQWGRLSRSLIEISRKKIANLLKVDASEIIFTSGGTEANNMIIKTVVQYLKIKRIITSCLEHKSILEVVSQLAQDQKIVLEFIKIKTDGSIDLENLQKKLKTSHLTTLVSLMHANNEIGNILPIEEVSKICKKYKTWFHSDTVQTIGHYALDIRSIGVDFASSSAHKFYGPVGSGFAFLRKNSIRKGFIMGGTQERGLRAGMENLYGILGMTKALELSLENLRKERIYIESLKNYAIFILKKKFPTIRFNGLSSHLDKSLYTLLNISFPIIDDLLSFHLDLKGIAVSQGSACLSGSTKTSYVIDAISDPEDNLYKTSLRISFGYFNIPESIDHLVRALQEYFNNK